MHFLHSITLNEYKVSCLWRLCCREGLTPLWSRKHFSVFHRMLFYSTGTVLIYKEMESKLPVKSEPVWSLHDEPWVVKVKRESRPIIFPLTKTEEDLDVCYQETDTEYNEELSGESCDVIKSEIEIEDNSLQWNSCELILSSEPCMDSSIQQQLLGNNSTEEAPPVTHPTYKCELCGKHFSKKSFLALHITTHTSEKPYRCETCSKCFSDSDLLAGHIRTHMGEKRFQCKTCGKCFIKSSDFAKHKRTHTGEKPYKCNICGKSFRLSNHLSRHLKIHSSEKPFKCMTCGKSFHQSKILTDHIKTHTGQKSFRCVSCGKCFARSHGLSRHNRIHTDVQPFKCELCGKCFSNSGTFHKHIRRIHTGGKVI